MVKADDFEEWREVAATFYDPFEIHKKPDGNFDCRIPAGDGKYLIVGKFDRHEQEGWINGKVNRMP